MAKLSDIFGRKGGEPDSDRFPPRPEPDLGNDHDQGNNRRTQFESFSDVGSRIGEENEALRNLLSDTGRKIGELDELKQAFDKIVQPFNTTLRALEQEKSHSIGLTGMLEESRAAYETLRAEFYQVERKATALESGERKAARRSRTGARVQSRTGKRAHRTVRRDLGARRPDRRTGTPTRAGNRATPFVRRRPPHRAGPGSTPPKSASSNWKASSPPRWKSWRCWKTKSARCRPASTSALNETARLTRRLTESENTLTATRAQLGKVEASFAEAYAERGRLSAALDESKEAHQAERNSLNMRLDALQSRAATAERLLAEARQNLLARTEEVRAFDRKSVEATISRNNAEKRLAQIEASHEAARTPDQDLEQAPRRADRAQQRDDQDAEGARNRAGPRRGKDRRR